jgi:pyrroline-5-carboxylate reductase
MTVALVGVGNLGKALVESLLAASYRSEDVILIERAESDRKQLSQRYGCRVESVIPAGIRLGAGDVIVLTVKPQDAEEACRSLIAAITPDVVVLSCMAGVSCGRLGKMLGTHKIVRAMPNLGAAFQESASAVFIPAGLSGDEVKHVVAIVNSCGKAWQVEAEELIDVATAVAGSGPAYFCWLAEQLEGVAVESGFSPHDAHALVLQTLKGAVSVLEGSAETFSALRKRVTSPNGTTAAALSVLEERVAAEHVRDAVRAALRRARELQSA